MKQKESLKEQHITRQHAHLNQQKGSCDGRSVRNIYHNQTR